jgi:hypothetical protein
MGYRSVWITENKVSTHYALGNTKLGNIASVSMPPGISCPKGIPCFKEELCYALRLYKQYKETANCWDTNFEVATKYSDAYFTNTNILLAEHYLKTKLFRWHVSGDILNQSYLENMKAIGRTFPRINFLAFTKNYDLHFARIPGNLQIVFSAWPSLPLKRKSFPVVWINDKAGKETRTPKSALKCKGHCDSCMACWKLSKIGRDVVINEH